ncbi:MAG TPA: transglutaminase domain-containing protein [Myxococcota bacterium]|nr:transglutaminase domain-containing protein [Myxococcota bacterium]HRY92414.1 transglutaminase domain-containing protein [Myxococcota bacterium]HSA21840.1 transglutaminase domain-containing protein [Myxococcota bacterium]
MLDSARMDAGADSQDFLRRARQEGRRYGDDAWVLLRELGQNSRDAGASRIEVRCSWEGGLLALSFADDGLGMTRAHARRYLFRLYASSKDSERSAAGRFGVGFWSVLRFEPAELEVHARTGRAAEPGWGVWLDGGLEDWRWCPCAHAGRGTTVRLRRPGTAEQLQPFRAEVRAGLERYLAHLRSCRRRAAPLPVWLDGELVSRPLGLPGADTLEFVEGPVEGVVGFGPRPAYRLLARGLPVAEGAFLEELEVGVRRVHPARPAAEREGVAPVFLLNGNQLRVVLSRQEVVRDQALERLLAVARRRFDELVSRTLDGAARPTPWRRLLTWLREAARGLSARPVWATALALALLLVVAGGALGLLAARARVARPEGGPAIVSASVPGDPPRPAPGDAPAVGLRPAPTRSPVLTAESAAGLRAGAITPAQAVEPGWALSYTPPAPRLFRLASLEEFEASRGFSPGRAPGGFAPASARDAGGQGVLEVELLLPAGRLGRPYLPVPTGFQPEARSGRLRGQPLPLEVSADGWLRPAREVEGPGPLRYRALPGGPRPVGLRTPPGWAAGLALPGSFERALEEVRGLADAERVARLTRAVQDALAYDRSAQAAERLRGASLGPPDGWAAAVAATGAGDCDVLNGVLALLLARTGLPARLVVGIVGQDGRGVPGLHAWVEVWLDGRLQVVDATAGARVAAPAAGGARPDAARVQAVAPGAPALVAPGPGATRAPAAASPLAARWLAIALGGLALLAGALLALSGLGQRGRLRARADPAARRALLAGMAEDALRRPRAWRHVPGLWYRPFLPCLHGRSASLAQLVERIPAGRMFVGRAGDALAEAARRAGALVLDADDPCFGPLFGRTAGLRELAELALDRPLDEARPAEAALLAALAPALASSGAPPCCLVEAGAERLCHDVDLSPLRPPPGSGWPRRFVALHRAHPFFQGLAGGLGQASPALAAAVLLDRLAEESSLLAAAAPALRRAVARAALEVPR